MREALAFLTIVPLKDRGRPPGRGALLAFPLVGAMVGAVWAGIAWTASRLWGALAAASLALLADLVITGGLHLDALADVADGLASRKPPEETKAVMRDPAIGAVGAAALVGAMLIRFAFIASIASAGSFYALIAAPAAGRFGMLAVMARARTVDSSSLAAELSSSSTPAIAAAGATAALAIGFVSARWWGAASILTSLLIAEVSARFFKRKLGDVTGDVVGATGMLAEAAALALMAAGRGG